MAIVVLSPYSGRAVKVRDEDVGRAVRDEAGRVFYVVARPAEAAAENDGEAGGSTASGALDASAYTAAGVSATHYGSRTRAGSAKDVERYDRLVQDGPLEDEVSGEAAAATGAGSTATAESALVAHDATGRARSVWPRVLLLLAVLAGLAIGVKLGWEALADRGVLGEPPWRQLEDVDLPDPTPLDGVPGEPVLPAQPELETLGASWSVRRVSALEGSSGMGVGIDVLPQQAWPGSSFGVVRTGSGLAYRVERRGDGPAAGVGQYVEVRRVVHSADAAGRVAAGEAGRSIGFVLGSGRVPRGLDEGVLGMRVGERRTLWVPASLMDAAGSREAVGVGAGAERFDVELRGVWPGVDKRVVRPGAGRFAGWGDRVSVHWSLAVEGDAAGSDSPRALLDTRCSGRSVAFTLGSGEVVAGVELGVVGMAEGEVAELEVPGYLAYGASGAAGGLIPPNATLRVAVEVLSVE